MKDIKIKLAHGEIIARICLDFEVSYDDVMSKSRKAELVDARSVIASVLFQLDIPKLTIARILRKKDHTTIINYLERLKNKSRLRKMANGYLEIFSK